MPSDRESKSEREQSASKDREIAALMRDFLKRVLK